jgi:WD40 repeat protein
MGHRNSRTVKGVSFFGTSDEYIMSGSDCGHIFIWKKKTAKLVRVMKGDRHVVNRLEPHPHIPILATCGIETNIKVWAPMASDAPPLPDNVEMVPSLASTPVLFHFLMVLLINCLILVSVNRLWSLIDKAEKIIDG